VWPSVRLTGFYAIPRFPGDRRAPQAESRGTLRSGLPSGPLGSGRRATARRSPAERETAWVWPSTRLAGFYAIPRSPGDRRAPQAESRGAGQCVAARCPLGSGRRATARRSPAERETAWVAVRTVRRLLRNPPVSGGSTSAAGRVEGDPAVRSAKRPPRLGSQSDRSPVPREAGDSVCMAVPGLRRRPPGGPEPRSPIERRTTRWGHRGSDQRYLGCG